MTENKKDDLTDLFEQPFEQAFTPSKEPASSESVPLDIHSDNPSEPIPEFASEFSPEAPGISENPDSIDMAPTTEPEIFESAPEHPSLSQVKQFAEEMPVARVQAQSEFPFTLKITGQLEPYEKTRLLDIISRENFGFRELDLEPQFEAGQILLPRISEYAGVLILQAIRSARVQVEFSPSDLETSNELFATDPQLNVWKGHPTSHHPAEILPVTSDLTLPQFENTQVADTLIVGARLRSDHVNPDGSKELSDAIDALTRELKYKAFYKGAKGLIQLKIETSTVGNDGFYHLTLSAITLV